MLDTKISKYRTQLMGVAILLIMYAHASFRFYEHEQLQYYYSATKIFAEIGVELFLILSGFGLYLSYSKRLASAGGADDLRADVSSAVSEFYKKRFLRIIPTYVLIVVAYSVVARLMDVRSISSCIESYSLITFFTRGVIEEWFLATILVFYLAFPLVYKLVNKLGKKMWLVLGLEYAFVFAISIMLTGKWDNVFRTVNEAFLARIPSFVIGAMIAKGEKDGDFDYDLENVSVLKIEERDAALLLVATVVVFAMNYKYNEINMIVVARLVYIPMAICIIEMLCVAFTKLEEKLDAQQEDAYAGSQKANSKLLRVFGFFGGITLEIYLLQEKIQELAWFVVRQIYAANPQLPFFSCSQLVISLVVNIIVIALTIVLAKAVSRLMSKLISK